MTNSFPSIDNAIETGHYWRLFYRTQRRFLAKMESSGKKIYSSLKDFVGENTKISNVLIQNCKNVLLAFFSFNSLLLVLFIGSLLLKRIKKKFSNQTGLR